MSPGYDERRPRAEGGGSSSGNSTQDNRSARARRAAALRLPPLEDGAQDPWADYPASGFDATQVGGDEFAVIALDRMSERQWRDAVARLRALGESAEYQRRNLEHLRQSRPTDYRGRAA